MSLLLHCGASGAPEICVVDGNDGPDDECATLMSLVEDWIADNEVDGALRPYLDDTLNLLADFTEASRLIVLWMEEDDPHVAGMRAALDAMSVILRPLMEALAKDE